MADDFAPQPALTPLPETTSSDGLPLMDPPLPSDFSGGAAAAASPRFRHRKNSSSLSDVTLLELDRTRGDTNDVELVVHNPSDEGAGAATIPMSTLIVVTDNAQLEEAGGEGSSGVLHDIMHDISDFDFTLEEGKFQVRNWDGKKGYSDYIAQGLKYKQKQVEKKKAEADKEEEEAAAALAANGETIVTNGHSTTKTVDTNTVAVENPHVVMLFESPSSSTADFTFHNKTKFRFHDWPPAAKTGGKSVLGPCRYALMNGTTYPVFLKDGTPPVGLLEHWKAAVPGFQPPSYVDVITDSEVVYAYLPVEQIRHHVNDPDGT